MILKGLNRKKEPIEVEIQGNIITRVTALPSEEKNQLSNYIIPGFIDIHTHGGYNTDFTDAKEESTRKYLRSLPKEGTTSILHASITTPKSCFADSIDTFSFCTSSKTRSGSLSKGSPQPPAPARMWRRTSLPNCGVPFVWYQDGTD